MIKKMLWLVIMVLITACSVYVMDGSLNEPQVTPTITATLCTDCTVIPTSSEVTETPIEATETAEITETEDPYETETVEATSTEIVTEEVTPTVESTAEATATEEPTATTEPTKTTTNTTVPSSTPTATATATPTFTPTVTVNPMTFMVQDGSPVYMVNFSNTTLGCSWSGVAGQVFDNDGNPLTNYIVKVTGTYNGKAINSVGVTGMVTDTPYGPASYEITFAKAAYNTTDTLSIQLFNSNGKALTDAIKFSTYSDCDKNLVIFNFKEK
jgi:hypothetical protein